MEQAGAIDSSMRELGEDRIGKLILKYSVPNIISMTTIAAYDVADQVFIARGVGYLGNGAANITFPFVVLAMALTMTFGCGGASMVSVHLGKKNRKEASKGACVGFTSIVMAGILLGILFNVFLEPFCRLFGASERLLPYAVAYGRFIALGIPFTCINAGFGCLICADGSPKYAMAGQMLGLVTNLIGDPLFIFGFHWGIRGAGLATLLAGIANSVMCLMYLRKCSSVDLSKEGLKQFWKTLCTITRLGIANIFTQIAMTFVLAVENNLFVECGKHSKYGTEIPIAAFGICMQMFYIVMQAVNGLVVGAQPIIGYNYGAGRADRVKKTIRILILLSTGVLFLATMWFQLAPMSVLQLMGQKSELYNEFAVKCLRVFFAFMALDGFQMTGVALFQSIGKPGFTTILSLSRQAIFLLPAMFLLIMKFGIMGILLAGPVADALACAVAIWMLCRSWKSL